MNFIRSEVPKGYHPLRYQAKAYDECTMSLSVFTEEEREYLERYRWLRDLKNFFKPEDLFSELKIVVAEKKTEQNLRDFEISNKSVRCAKASTLHSLIPFVKRLVRLFPHTME
jgi:hypothetical protein